MNTSLTSIFRRVICWWHRIRPALHEYGEKNLADLESWAKRRAERELGVPLQRKSSNAKPIRSGDADTSIRQPGPRAGKNGNPPSTR